MMRAVALLAAMVAPSVASASDVEIHGNVALPSAVYQSVIILSEAAWTTTATATTAKKRTEHVRRSVLDFLLASGYDLATATATTTNGRIHVTVDEGRLDKIIFLRQGTIRTLDLKLSIKLPGDVFNRPLLEQQLRSLVEETDFTKATFRVVRVEEVRHAGVQLREPRLLRSLEFLKAGAPHELHITLERPEQSDGLRVGIGIASPDGFFGKVSYDTSSVIIARDRMNTETRVGIRLDDEIDTPSNPIGLSRVRLAAEWHTPPLADLVTSFLRLEANMYGRLRRDLSIANYYYLPVAASLNFAVAATRSLTVGLGGGFEDRFLFGIDELPGETIAPLVEATEREDLRVFMGGTIDWVIDHDDLRLDRQHRFTLDGTFLGKGSLHRSEVITKLRVGYENMWPIGYDEFHIGANGVHIFGQAKFYDELSIGDGFLRAAFGNEIYFRRAVGTRIEYRVSLSRDVVKLAIFDDVAIYEGLDGQRDPLGIRLATTFGVGVNVLLLDAFQLDAYTGIGLAAGREVGFGFALSVTRAY